MRTLTSSLSPDKEENRHAGPRGLPLGSFLLLALLMAFPLAGVDCSVPGDHASIQEAIDAPDCSRILLADQTYEESLAIDRSVEVIGGGASTIAGPIAVTGSVQVALDDLSVAGCSGARVSATEGAQVVGDGLVVAPPISPPCFPLFYDGFESGDTQAWSSTVP